MSLNPERRGIVIGGQSRAYCDPEALRCGWWYNYRTHPDPEDCPTPAWYIPMLFDERVVGDPLYTESGVVLWLSEPDVASAADLSPAEAASWFQQARALYPNHVFVGPNISQNGEAWLQAYMGEVAALYPGEGPPYGHARFGFHQYLSVEGGMILAARIQQMADLWGIRIWNTEFRYETEADEQAWVEYCLINEMPCAHFKARITPAQRVPGSCYSTPLVEEDGTLTPMGWFYRGLGA